MRPTITHQIKPNIVSFLYLLHGMLFPGGRIRDAQNQCCPS
jgi:hypothetical protein